jgi:hypothetical protein
MGFLMLHTFCVVVTNESSSSVPPALLPTTTGRLEAGLKTGVEGAGCAEGSNNTEGVEGSGSVVDIGEFVVMVSTKNKVAARQMQLVTIYLGKVRNVILAKDRLQSPTRGVAEKRELVKPKNLGS